MKNNGKAFEGFLIRRRDVISTACDISTATSLKDAKTKLSIRKLVNMRVGYLNFSVTVTFSI